MAQQTLWDPNPIRPTPVLASETAVKNWRADPVVSAPPDKEVRIEQIGYGFLPRHVDMDTSLGHPAPRSSSMSRKRAGRSAGTNRSKPIRQAGSLPPASDRLPGPDYIPDVGTIIAPEWPTMINFIDIVLDRCRPPTKPDDIRDE
jgi:hypothetical protein